VAGAVAAAAVVAAPEAATAAACCMLHTHEQHGATWASCLSHHKAACVPVALVVIFAAFRCIVAN